MTTTTARTATGRVKVCTTGKAAALAEAAESQRESATMMTSTNHMTMNSEKASRHPAVAQMVIEELQASNAALQAFIASLFPEPLTPDEIRAALAPETENQYEAI